MNSDVNVWEEDKVIPTYGIGKPEKNPIFLERRVYQGSSGAVYPYPVIEKIFDEKKGKTYHACFLENKYLKIMILPELGGRVQMAYDKVKQRHFIYYNEVIKPALVGLTGPWISGGIEFNWPQHHRPSTFEPLDFCIEENSDGSKTVWCNEIERMSRTKSLTGFTLYPQKAYLEISVKLYNRTPYPQTFLWWANPAVHVNDHYQSVFPPDVHAVFDHGKRDVSTYPIATGKYYKVDYSAGVDISKYKNIPVPTSYMAVKSEYDFVGGYEHDSHGGLLHIANHNISPGKKQWTWGNGDFGKAWDKNLTDNNGPYIELMCGVFTDNQPDFSWLMPYEEKSFKQYFMPYRDLGVVKNATKEAMLNLEINEGEAIIKVYTTSTYENAKVELKYKEKILLSEAFDFSPEVSFNKSVALEKGIKNYEVSVKVTDSKRKFLVGWKPEKDEVKKIPEPAAPARLPYEINEIEQLYLTALHLEQYRHATYDPTDYYKEALKRDPGDIRCNNAMGLWLLRHGRFIKAEKYFSNAISTITKRNPNPYDGEPYYNLGCSLKLQGRLDKAYDAFYKAGWNAAWQDAAYFSLAQIAVYKSDFINAIELIEQSLSRNQHNQKAIHLKVVILRKLGRRSEAMKLIESALAYDKFNIGCLFEKYLVLTEDLKREWANAVKNELIKLMRGWEHNYIEYALDYSSTGLFDEASELLSETIVNKKVYPMNYYLLGYFASCSGNKADATNNYLTASGIKPDYCFPNRIEEVLALKDAVKLNSNDSKAFYYLGNFWYANRQYNEALACWEKSASMNKEFPTVWRNLALIYYNKYGKKEKALEALERAFELDTSDDRILMELDQLYKKMGKSALERLAFLERYLTLVESRDDLYLERIMLYNQLSEFAVAKELILNHKFHPWEGGEGKVTSQYVISQVELGKIAHSEKRFKEALDLFLAAKSYPDKLGEGKLFGAKENDIDYHIGSVYEAKGDNKNAQKYFRKASAGISEPSNVFFYNDQTPDKIYYQGIALLKLGQKEKADNYFKRLINYGSNHLADNIKMDYFAVSLPDMLLWEEDLNRRNQINCNYLIGLGFLGLGNKEKAQLYLQETLELDINHLGAIVHLAMSNNTENISPNIKS